MFCMVAQRAAEVFCLRIRIVLPFYLEYCLHSSRREDENRWRDGSPELFAMEKDKETRDGIRPASFLFSAPQNRPLGPDSHPIPAVSPPVLHGHLHHRDGPFSKRGPEGGVGEGTDEKIEKEREEKEKRRLEEEREEKDKKRRVEREEREEKEKERGVEEGEDGEKSNRGGDEETEVPSASSTAACACGGPVQAKRKRNSPNPCTTMCPRGVGESLGTRVGYKGKGGGKGRRFCEKVGVTWDPKNSRWRAKLTVGTQTYLKNFPVAVHGEEIARELAIAARQEMKRKHLPDSGCGPMSEGGGAEADSGSEPEGGEEESEGEQRPPGETGKVRGQPEGRRESGMVGVTWHKSRQRRLPPLPEIVTSKPESRAHSKNVCCPKCVAAVARRCPSTVAFSYS
uniref:AP2/ERF domain-containing protein n=1 Tax=Chromera velia CCMP2878 TaxID=1169474 RepID=A0A0G4GY40_9ALVE|eukprot:Cvel_23841.t1-p1 / transcript=Cvel_23841.t1 / gene=Cvel_23841 / organism=Chromera_velia_CCMP2878 / gene_product=hypothetical protein / transcript_product=hypothetical protein / location=Cvel_scaffold2507:19856-21881(+) / protein_length=397 / sequence_SO=supercontig / SO=protein_coding / is_pseudo=false